MESGPPAPHWNDFLATATAEFKALLSSSADERALQHFFERNPAFVPGAETPGTPSGHGPLFGFLFAQPPLPGLASKIPDFMWVAMHSLAWFPTFIEIEDPKKRVFTDRAVPRQEFTHARNQLAQWRSWFNAPANALKFRSDYGIPDDLVRIKRMTPHFLLVYGRRSEIEHEAELSNQRGALMTGLDEELLSYDRVHANRLLHDAITVRASGYGKYKALAAMPTLTLGPSNASRLQRVDGLEEAIEGDERIPTDRRKFLVTRLEYWRQWGVSLHDEPYNPQDSE
jgi:hypothetical protein